MSAPAPASDQSILSLFGYFNDQDFDTYYRYLTGDLSLIQEIQSNAASNAPVNRLARELVANDPVGVSKDKEQHKKRRLVSNEGISMESDVLGRRQKLELGIMEIAEHKHKLQLESVEHKHKLELETVEYKHRLELESVKHKHKLDLEHSKHKKKVNPL